MAPPSACTLFSFLLGLSHYVQPAIAEPGILAFPLKRHEIPQLHKREGFEDSLINVLPVQAKIATTYQYVINITIGTPPQALLLLLDTSSSDLWVPSPQIAQCGTGKCSVFGTFDPTKSSTYKDRVPGITVGWNTSYGDERKYQGNYFTDVVEIEGTKLTNVIMGLSTSASIPQGFANDQINGIMGVGFDNDEALAGFDGGTTNYPNIISQLASQKVTNTRAYSLFLNEFNATTGSIIFGGIDTAKYTGSLVSLPLQLIGSETVIHKPTVLWSGLQISLDGTPVLNIFNLSMLPAALDSGTSWISVPIPLHAKLLAAVDGVSDGNGNFYVDCGLVQTDVTLDFRFGDYNGPYYSVPIGSFIEPPTAGQNFVLSNGDPACRWNVQVDRGLDYILLGDSFMRAAYLVYNQDGKEILIAPANYAGAGTSSLVAIAAATGLPGVASTATGTLTLNLAEFGLTAAPSVPTGTQLPDDPANGSPDTAAGTATFQVSGTNSILQAASSKSQAAASTAHTGAGAGPNLPSSPFIGSVVAAVVILLGLLSGSMLMLT